MDTRRSFIKQSLAGSAAISLSGAVPRLLLTAAASVQEKSAENILVVVQLTGGNDGLNTIVPYGDDEYYKNRFTLAVAKSAVLKINGQIGFHPALTGFDHLLNQGQLSIVQGVGYPNPNRSHFESLDLWQTAHQSSTGVQSGWLGRVVEGSLLNDDLPAVHFGNGLQPIALRTENKPVPSVRSIADFKLNAMIQPQSRSFLEPLLNRATTNEQALLSYLYDSSRVAMATSHQLESVSQTTVSDFKYPGSNLGKNLSVIAQLIGSGLSTRIYYVTLDGFDTHSNQAAAHQSLLSDLSDSVLAFIEQLTDQGNDKRVAVLAFSEFGRRVRENASAGTDHGTAAPVFLFGSGIKQGLVGDHPSLKEMQDGDLKFAIDYRRIYADLLEHWLGVDSEPILNGKFQTLDLFGARS